MGETPIYEVPRILFKDDDIVYSPKKYRETEGAR